MPQRVIYAFLFLCITIKIEAASIIQQVFNVALNQAPSCNISGIPAKVDLELAVNVATQYTTTFVVNCNMQDKINLTITSSQYQGNQFYLKNDSSSAQIPLQLYINSNLMSNSPTKITPNTQQTLLVRTAKIPAKLPSGVYSGNYSFIISY